MKAVEEGFTGNFDVLRVIFSTDNPIETLYNLRCKYPVSLFYEYLEYLDVQDELKDVAKSEHDKKAKAEQAKNRRGR